jgi:hypothetical protein
MTHLSKGIFIIAIVCIVLFIAIIAMKKETQDTLNKNEGFQQREVYKEPETQKLLGQLYTNVKTRAYLNDLIKADYIQSYPWFVSNPNGATTYNKRLFNQSNDEEQIETQNQNYYDFGEITYIGNPL